MRKLLEKLMKENEITNIYTDIDDTEHCYTGYINELDEEYVLIGHISARGLYDGYVLREIADIVRLETRDDYTKKVKKLYELRKQSHEELELGQQNSLLDELLEFCLREKKMITIDLTENDETPVTGTLEETGDVLCVRSYCNYGTEDGFAYVRKEDIKVLSVDTAREQDILLLSRNQPKKI